MMIILSFLIGIATAFFTIFAIHILCYRRQRTRFQTVVGIIMTIWALSCAKDLVLCLPGFYNDGVLDWVFIIDGWSAITYTVLVMEVVQPNWTTWRRLLLLALPFGLLTMGFTIWPEREMVYAYSAFLWFYAWTVVIYGWVRMNRRLSYLRREYSNIDKIDVSWLRPVFIFTIVGQLGWLFTSLYPTMLYDIIYYICIIILWLFVLYYSWDFKPVVMEEPAETDENAQVEIVRDTTPQDESRSPLSIGMLEKIVEEKKLYLNPSLTQNDLAHEMDTNRTYISNYLSKQMNMTFYDYINMLRIKSAAMPLMREHPEYKFEYVASKSGFASISTFRRAFVKVTGQTPSQYAATIADQI